MDSDVDTSVHRTILCELGALIVTPILVTLAWIVFILMKTDFSSMGMTLTTVAVSVLRAEFTNSPQTSTKALTIRFVIASSLTTVAAQICGVDSLLLDGPSNPFGKRTSPTSGWNFWSSRKPVTSHYEPMIICYFGILGIISTIRSFDYLLGLMSRLDFKSVSNYIKSSSQIQGGESSHRNSTN